MTEDTFSTLLARFRTAEPYVWRLHVGDALFARLEAHVAALAASGTARLAADDARLVLMYMGEWYRRRYCAATFFLVRSEELGVRSEGNGAQNLEAPSFYKRLLSCHAV